jgi:hypothetical protein
MITIRPETPEDASQVRHVHELAWTRQPSERIINANPRGESAHNR